MADTQTLAKNLNDEELLDAEELMREKIRATDDAGESSADLRKECALIGAERRERAIDSYRVLLKAVPDGEEHTDERARLKQKIDDQTEAVARMRRGEVALDNTPTNRIG